jgi:6-phosphogluconolactonase
MRAAAERVVDLAERAVGARGRFTWALAGGSTPEELYSLLASSEFEGRIDWTRVHFFWADERCVSPDHEQSNYRMARRSLLDVIRPPAAHVHRMQGELAPALAARAYEQELEGCFERSVGDGFPRFDLILLGMGADGHTASLFPGSAALEETRRWVVDHQVPQLGAERLTFTLPLLNAAAHVLFLVAGTDKAPRLRAVLDAAPALAVPPLAVPPFGVPLYEPLPAARVRPGSGELEWLVDAPAAALLPPSFGPIDTSN